MSKERLEEIAYNVGISIDGEKALMSSDDYDFLYNYALEQAERVQELENHLKLYDFWYRTAYEQNKRYREALEKISAPIDKVTYAYMFAVKQIARQALEGEK